MFSRIPRFHLTIKLTVGLLLKLYLSHYLNHIFYVYARFFKQRSRLHERTTLIFPSKQFTSNDRQYHELSTTNNLFEILKNIEDTDIDGGMYKM